MASNLYSSLISQHREERLGGGLAYVPLTQYTLIHQEGSHWLELVKAFFWWRGTAAHHNDGILEEVAAQ